MNQEVITKAPLCISSELLSQQHAHFPLKKLECTEGANKQSEEVINDTQRGMLSGIPKSAICVQRFDDSLNSAIRITYRISLRSSSSREPRYPLLRVVYDFLYFLICVLLLWHFEKFQGIKVTTISHKVEWCLCVIKSLDQYASQALHVVETHST